MLRRWEEEDVKTGYFSFDEQHKELFEIISELQTSVENKRAKGDISMAFDFLGNYTKSHLSMEEGIMQKKGYPYYAQHKAEHDFFEKEFLKLRESFESSGDPATWEGVEELRALLIDWNINHIMVEDSKVANFIKNNKV